MRMAYLVVRIKGTVNVPHWANSTLDYLHLRRKFSATLLPENKHSLGMLRKVKDLVAWCSADAEIIKDLLSKKARRFVHEPMDKSNFPEEYKNIELLAKDLAEDKIVMSKVNGIRPWFALNPPRGGFKRSTKKHYSQHGILGEDQDLISIVRRMI
jgi:large subunit ribosomal protein L30